MTPRLVLRSMRPMPSLGHAPDIRTSGAPSLTLGLKALEARACAAYGLTAEQLGVRAALVLADTPDALAADAAPARRIV